VITLIHYLVVAAIVFALGLLCAITSASVLRVILGVELMLNAVNLNLAAFALFAAEQPAAGLSFVIFLIVVAAAEVGLALALVVALSRTHDTSTIDSFTTLRG
jgi:NADH-quinone oxidoreductase subunit K